MLHCSTTDGVMMFTAARMGTARLKRLNLDTGVQIWSKIIEDETGTIYPFDLQQDISGVYVLTNDAFSVYRIQKREKSDGSFIWNKFVTGIGNGTGLFLFGDYCYIVGAWYGGISEQGYFIQRRLKSTGVADYTSQVDGTKIYYKVFVDSSGVYITFTDSGEIVGVEKLDLNFAPVWSTTVDSEDSELAGYVVLNAIFGNSSSIYVGGVDYHSTDAIAEGLCVILDKDTGAITARNNWPAVENTEGNATQYIRGIFVFDDNVYLGGQRWNESLALPLDTKRVMQRNFPPWLPPDGHYPV